ncbi:MAG: hypothetical protein BWX88_01112 [Planctomycetes bacterium ADurb.Bin126]|nr:MAG: hypothetical protein BWX88_01112 [Planctomycetes bacterium ADurb.Bin126]HOD83839.1 hypothetical protein [Phycisphaerae bacterium]HQL72716.1 hypothetical protein [Phycisphaerae bacterium]
MTTTFTFFATASSGPAQDLPLAFDYAYAYEDRNEIQTSRWSLTGLDTRNSGNTHGGWLYLRSTREGDQATVRLYKDPACAAEHQVASGSADLATLDARAARCTLQSVNSSRLAGEFFFERYVADPEQSVPVLVCLCVDEHLREEYQNLDQLGSDVYETQAGMARFCAAATRKTLLTASQQYAVQLGGFGAPEHRNWPAAGRATPDFRRLASPDQLRETAVHWALMLAFGSCHERADDTMYSRLRDYHDLKRKEAIAAWNLALVSDPDAGGQADHARSVGARYVTRL